MPKAQQFVLGVATVFMVGLLLAPLSAYASRLAGPAEVPDQGASARGGPSNPMRWDDLLAMCYRRATANDPGDLAGTWSCAGYDLPGHNVAPAAARPPSGELQSVRKHESRATSAPDESAP